MACPPPTVAQPPLALAADAAPTPLAMATPPAMATAPATPTKPAIPTPPPARTTPPELGAAARLALPPTVGLGTLRRLLQLDFGARVLSLYVDRGGGVGGPDTMTTALEALVEQIQERLTPQAAGRICESLRAIPPLACGVRGVAVFAGAAGHPLETVSLPARVDTFAVIDALPWLEPLAAMAAVHVQRRRRGRFPSGRREIAHTSVAGNRTG